MSLTVVSVLGYVALQLVFGFLVAKRVNTEADYLLAGRSLGLPVSTFTVFATWFGAETCIGAAAEAYRSGLSGVTADPFGYAACLLLMGALLAAPLWRRKLTTLADLFRARYGPGVERLAVLLMVPTSVMWAGAQIRAFGQVLGVGSELARETSITIAAVVVVIYTSMGGLLADALSDFAQGIVLLAGLALLCFQMVDSGDLALAQLSTEALSLRAPGASWLDVIEAWSVPVLGSLVAQELVARVVAAKSAQTARRASLMAGVMYFAAGSIPVLVGLSAAHTSPGLAEPEQVLIVRAAHYMPGAVHLVFTGALVSAILSTVDSALLVAGSLCAHNLVLPLYPGLGERQKIRVNRLGVVFFGGVAYVLALSTEGVYALVEEASALGTAGVLVCMLFALFTHLGGALAAAASLTLGLATYLLAHYVLDARHPYVASLAAALCAYLVGAALEPTRGPAELTKGSP